MRGRMRGAILLLTLVYLLLLALVATSVVGSATYQLRMAANEQSAAATRARARAIAREVARHPANFDPAAAVGDVRCVSADPGSGCDAGGLLPLPEPLADVPADYRVLRRAPLELVDVLLEGGELAEPGAPFALYEVRVRVGAGAAGAEAVRGVLLGLPVAGRTPAVHGGHAGEAYGVYWRFPATDPL